MAPEEERRPWPAERVVEAQRSVIAHWRQRATSAEKLLAKAAAQAGRDATLLRACEAALDAAGEEIDRLNAILDSGDAHA